MYSELITELNEKNVKLVAVSKTKPVSAILNVYQRGQKIFGENRAQELAQKYEELPKDIEWHLIGRLQKNKAKLIAPFVSLIHSVDSLKLLKEINKQAKKHGRVIDCLLQLKIAQEDSKFGMSLSEACSLLESNEVSELQNVRIVGVMGMATFTYDQTVVRSEFAELKSSFDELKEKYFSNVDFFKEISMGMSGDYEIAIDEGSTMVRIGSLIFGAR